MRWGMNGSARGQEGRQWGERRAVGEMANTKKMICACAELVNVMVGRHKTTVPQVRAQLTPTKNHAQSFSSCISQCTSTAPSASLGFVCASPLAAAPGLAPSLLE